MRNDEDDDVGADFPDSKVVKETDRAVLCDIALEKHQTRRIWIPKSIIHDDSEVFDATEHSKGKLILKTWWAEKEGLL